MFANLNGLVLREARYREADRILTIFTLQQGKITVKARGALRKSSHLAAATQQLTYSDFTMFYNKDRWSINEAVIHESFDGLRSDIASLALGCYIAECIDTVSMENEPDPALLQLALNSLYAISRNLYPRKKIKAVFELRLMQVAGYAPDLRNCCVCGREIPEKPIFLINEGNICCNNCVHHRGNQQILLGDEVLSAMRYIQNSSAKRIFSFEIEEKALNTLSIATESFLVKSTERILGTLQYYHSVDI